MYYKIFKKKKKSSCHNVMQIFVTAPRLLLSISSEGERLGRSQMETSSHPHSVGPQAKSLEFVPYCLKAKPREKSAEGREGERKGGASPRADGHKPKLCPRWKWPCISGAHPGLSTPEQGWEDSRRSSFPWRGWGYHPARF